MTLNKPEPGQVIRHAFLWHGEHLAGSEEGRKDRPAVVVVAWQKEEGDPYQVAVLPITHTMPKDLSIALEIPPKVKRHLTLDGERSWIILNEVNEFTWPGYDLRPLPGVKGEYIYGFLPPRLFEQVIERIKNLGQQQRLKVTLRDEEAMFSRNLLDV